MVTRTKWSKDARLGTDADVAAAFAARVADDLYLGAESIDSELGGCQPHVIRTNGQDWLRFLPTGDVVITGGGRLQFLANGNVEISGGELIENQTEYTNAYPPAFAIADANGRVLLAVDGTTGNVQIAGTVSKFSALTEESSISEWIYRDSTGTILAKFTQEGDFCLKDGRNVVTADNDFLNTIDYRDWPEPEDGYQGHLDSELERCLPAQGGDCECFRQTEWYSPLACTYPTNPQVQFIQAETRTSANHTPAMAFSETGSVYIWNGQVVAENGAAPSGDEQILVTCDGQTQAKLITWEDNGVDVACLWLRGKVIVGKTPESPPDACWYTVYNTKGQPVAQIDGDGNLVLQGIVHASSGVVPGAYNMPYSPGGGTSYE